MANKSNLNRYKQKNKSIIKNKTHIVKKIDNTEEITKNIDETRNNNANSIFLKNRNFLVVIVIVFTGIVFLNSINNDFVNWDDDRYVTGNQNLEFNYQNLKKYFSEPYFVMYIPFTMVSYMIDYELGGGELNPQIFHSHNYVLHLLNTVLLFFLIAKLFEDSRKNKYIYAFFVSLIFGVHSLHVESVSWIAERKDVLYTVFFFSSLLFYLNYIKSRKVLLYGFSLLFFLFSLMSKSQAVVLPLILISIDYLNRNFLNDSTSLKSFILFKNKKQWTVLFEKLPFFVLSIIFGVIAVKASGTSEPFAESISTNTKIAVNTGYGFYESIMLVSYSLTKYFALAIIPFKQSAFHPYPFDVGSMPSYFNLYILFPILLLSAFVYSWIKKWKIIVFSILFFIFNIFIVLKIKNFIISEHYLYIPSIGLSFILIFLSIKLIEFKKSFKNAILVLSVIYILFLSYNTFERNKIFTNSLTFWNDVTEKYPEVIVAYFNRGNYLQEQGDLALINNTNKSVDFYNKAINEYTLTVNLHPQNKDAYSNRGITYAKIRDYEKAIEDFNKVISIDSSYQNVYSNRGNAYAMLNMWDKAINDYNTAINGKPDFYDAIYNRGVAFFKVNRYKDAIIDLNSVVNIEKYTNDALKHRAFSYYFDNQYRKALNDLNLYLRNVNSDYNAMFYQALSFEKLNIMDSAEMVFNNLRINYPQIIDDIKTTAINLESGADYNNSVELYEKALELFYDILKIDVNNSEAYLRIGVVYGKLGDLTLSIKMLTEAIKLNADNDEAYTNRGYAYNLLNNTNLALDDYNKAISLNPQSVTAFFNRALLFEKLGNINNALIDINNAIKFDTTYSTAYFRRGILYQKSGKISLACKDWKHAVSQGVSDAQSYLNKYCN